MINSTERRQNKLVRDPPWLLNPGQTSPEVQNGLIGGPTKKNYVLQLNFQKNNSVQKGERSFLN